MNIIDNYQVTKELQDSFNSQPPSYIEQLRTLVPSVRKQRLEYIKQQLKKEEQVK
jgi:hypothetical protein